jgi:DNA (cytosine-5)-methyltransferase 1
MQNGALYLLPTLVQTISVKESGSEQKQMWLTPRVVEVDETPENFRRRMNSKRPNDRKDGFGSLTMQVKAIQKWPTPTASDGTSGAVIGKNDTFYTTSTGMPRKVNQNGKDGSVGLGRLVQMWPTPTASKGGSWRSDGQIAMIANNVETYQEYLMLTKGSCKSKLDKYWPTPQASDNRDRGNMSNPSIQRRIEKGKQIMLSQSVDPNSGQLNPTWVEWLMGWPLGWTDLKPLEMDKSLYVQQQLGNY